MCRGLGRGNPLSCPKTHHPPTAAVEDAEPTRARERFAVPITHVVVDLQAEQDEVREPSQ